MAKKSVVLRNEKRIKIVKQHAVKRAELKALAIDFSIPDEERYLARVKLQDMPRNSAANRVRNRCQVTGRGRGVYRKYMVSRIVLREFAHKGLLPGLRKSSW